MAIYPKATSELNIYNDDVGDATSPPDFINTNRTISISNREVGSAITH